MTDRRTRSALQTRSERACTEAAARRVQGRGVVRPQSTSTTTTLLLQYYYYDYFFYCYVCDHCYDYYYDCCYLLPTTLPTYERQAKQSRQK